MLKFLALRRHLQQFIAATLGQDRMTRVAIIRFDDALSIGGLVLTIVAAETARPILMANVIRINLPTGLHFGKKVFLINFLRGFDGPAHAILAVSKLVGGIT